MCPLRFNHPSNPRVRQTATISFKDGVAEYTRQEIYQLVRQKEGLEALELNVQADHVHLVLWLPPKYAVSEVMGYLKGKLATRLFRQDERFGRSSWGRHLWGRGYCVGTVGFNEEQIRQYVRWQEQKEREQEQLQGKLFAAGEE